MVWWTQRYNQILNQLRGTSKTVYQRIRAEVDEANDWARNQQILSKEMGPAYMGTGSDISGGLEQIAAAKKLPQKIQDFAESDFRIQTDPDNRNPVSLRNPNANQLGRKVVAGVVNMGRGVIFGNPREYRQAMSVEQKIINGIPISEDERNVLKRISEGNMMAIAGQTGEIQVGKALPKKAPEEALDPVRKLIGALKEAKFIRKGQESLYTKERATRVARVASVGQRVGGERGYYAQLGQLKGELPKKQFESIRGKFTQGDIDALFNTVEQTKTLLPLEKVTAKTGLAKMFGEGGGTVPTEGELELLRQAFPEELIGAILEKRPISEKILRGIGEALNIPRSVMATLDLSAPLRQGIFLVGRPKQWAPAVASMFKYAFSEKAYEGAMDSIKLRPTYSLMREGRLALTDVGSVALAGREEQFMSNLVERVPGIGKLARGSNRAYTGFLNKLRADTFDDLIRKADALGVEKTDKFIGDAAKFVNAATGRGELGALSKAAPVLNSTFFSPRLMASRINLLNPYFYYTLDPMIRREALKSLLTFGATATTVLGLTKLAGADVGDDPRSADFGKIKIGNTRYDVLGGFQQPVRLAAQLVAGQVVSTTTGRTITLGEGYKPLTRKDILMRYFENKESPVASFVMGWLQGQTATGEDFDIKGEVASRLIPMIIQDLYDIYIDRGSVGLLEGVPAIFGAGMQTYGKQELAEGVNQIGEKTVEVRPVRGLSEKITEKAFGKKPLGTSKSYNVEAYFDQLSNLPREEAATVFDFIAKSNPELADKIREVVKDREKDITVEDKDLKTKGVTSGDRAVVIKAQLDKLGTDGEKAQLWDDYVRKGIITKEVARQLGVLMEKE